MLRTSGAAVCITPGCHGAPWHQGNQLSRSPTFATVFHVRFHSSWAPRIRYRVSIHRVIPRPSKRQSCRSHQSCSIIPWWAKKRAAMGATARWAKGRQTKQKEGTRWVVINGEAIWFLLGVVLFASSRGTAISRAINEFVLADLSWKSHSIPARLIIDWLESLSALFSRGIQVCAVYSQIESLFNQVVLFDKGYLTSIIFWRLLGSLLGSIMGYGDFSILFNEVFLQARILQTSGFLNVF